MSIRRKVFSIGTSAALLASLLTAIAAPAAFASVTVTSAGNVPQDGTSAGTATFVLTEQAIGSLTNAAGSIDITIAPAAPIVGAVTFSGTPVVSAPGSLGASASIVGSVLTVSWTNSDVANIESITVSGLTIDATATATPGAITATLGNPTGNASIAAFQGGGTASGFLATGVSIGALAATVNVTTTGCAFVNTVGVVPDAGPYAFAAGIAGTSAESLEGTAGALNAPLPGQQVLTITTVGGFTSAHNAGDVVTQTTACAPNGVLASPGTVVQALTYANPTPKLTVFPGENNSPAQVLTITEPAAGFLVAASTFTYTIATPGVVFSTAPTVSDNNAGMTLSAPVLSVDRKSATVTVSTVSTVAGAAITLSDILYDVAATVPGGTFISVGITTSGAKVVLPASRTNAVVFRGIVAVSATTPVVYIGENGQAAGIISFTEAAAGFFTDGTGPNNTFEICPIAVNYVFTLAPYAKVTGGVAAGNLVLRDGAGASTTNIVKGTQDGSCYYWTVWTKSTTASTIQIGNSDFTSGPIINVSVNQYPGAVAVDLYIGSSALDDQLVATVAFAVAVYRTSVAVTALSVPVIPAGALNALVGNIQVAETGLGQLKNGELICVEVLPRAGTSGGTGPGSGIQETFFGNQATANVPIVTTSGTGLVLGPVSFEPSFNDGDDCGDPSGGAPATQSTAFSFQVLQQSVAGDGKLVISNIHYTTTADAATGLIQVRVSGANLGSPTVKAFQSIISNARIGDQLAGTAATRLGVTKIGAFTTSTKVATVGKYVTYRFDLGVGAAGQTFEIWGATKTGNDWSAFAKVTARVANASGVVYYYIRQNSATWKSYRAYWSAGGVWTPARQARWIP